VNGRVLICRGCGEPIRVYELPGPFIDPALYVGIVCGCSGRTSSAEEEPQYEQRSLFAAPLEETRDYDPMIAEIPF
jgi:hypothetical protein